MSEDGPLSSFWKRMHGKAGRCSLGCSSDLSCDSRHGVEKETEVWSDSDDDETDSTSLCSSSRGFESEEEVIEWDLDGSLVLCDEAGKEGTPAQTQDVDAEEELWHDLKGVKTDCSII